METATPGSEKRRFARFAVVARVEVMHTASGRMYTALTRDLSLEGIGLLQAGPMQKGEEFSVSLPRGKATHLVAQCKVMHARELADGIWGIGAIFVTAAPAATPPKPAAGSEAGEAKRIAAKMLG
jgi:hypothetical protein